MGLLIRWLINALALLIVSRLLPGFRIDDIASALIAVVMIGIVNILIKPLLSLLTLPITFLTFGLFSFILNALMLMLAAYFTPGFIIEGFGVALIGSILLTIVSTILHGLIR